MQGLKDKTSVKGGSRGSGCYSSSGRYRQHQIPASEAIRGQTYSLFHLTLKGDVVDLSSTKIVRVNMKALKGRGLLNTKIE